MKRAAERLGVAALIAIVSCVACQRPPKGEKRHRVMGKAFEQLLESPMPEWMPGDSARRVGTWSALLEFYERRGKRLAWIRNYAPTHEAAALATLLDEAAADGLDPAAYGAPVIRATLDSARTPSFATADSLRPELAELDLRLSAAFLQYAQDLRSGRFPPSVLDSDWIGLRDTIDAVGLLKKALASHQVAEALETAPPASPRYQRLREALQSHRRIAEQGGWPEVPAGGKLARGDEHPRCAIARRRLVLSGDIADTSGGATFDAALERGVRSFQARHGLVADGKIGDTTLAALRVPVADRIRTLEMNLERARWVTHSPPEPYIRVNIPEFRLRLVNGGVDSMVMRVVVGQPSNPTPVFSDLMTYLEFNPVWRLPRRLVAEEVLPGYRRDRRYFEKHQMRVLQTSRRGLPEVDPASVAWHSISADTFHYLVQQDPGPENPLGQIKFMLPNEYDVYLHDTSARGYFRRDARALSHGCVRVEKPLALADYVLRGRPQGEPDSVRAIVESRLTRRISAPTAIPVHVEYWTAWVDTAGAVNFRPDLYHLDARMREAIADRTEAQFVLNPAVEWKEKASGSASRIAHRPDAAWTPRVREVGHADSTAHGAARR